MDDPADKPEISNEVPPETSQAGQPAYARLGTTPRWDGAITKNRMGHLATIPVTVRWDSAAVVRHALEAAHEPGVEKINAAAPNDFVITVVGLLPGNTPGAPATLQTKSSSDDGARVRSAEENLEWFMGNSHLQAKGGSTLQPENVTIDTATGAVHLFFRRSPGLTAHKRDVLFTTRFGTMNVQARFRIKDMTVNGQPDL